MCRSPRPCKLCLWTGVDGGTRVSPVLSFQGSGGSGLGTPWSLPWLSQCPSSGRGRHVCQSPRSREGRAWTRPGTGTSTTRAQRRGPAGRVVTPRPTRRPLCHSSTPRRFRWFAGVEGVCGDEEGWWGSGTVLVRGERGRHSRSLIVWFGAFWFPRCFAPFTRYSDYGRQRPSVEKGRMNIPIGFYGVSRT